MLHDLEGFILAGGASSRMGQDKGLLRLDGQTLIEHVRAALSPVVARTRVVSARHDESDLPLPVVPDIFHDCGALGGLHAALKAARTPWSAVVSCDLPFVSAELFLRLASLRTPAAAAVVPLQRDGRVQPLCALYRQDGCLKVVEEMLTNGELRPRMLLTKVRARLVAPDEYADLKEADLFFLNVNTPVELKQAAALMHARRAGIDSARLPVN